MWVAGFCIVAAIIGIINNQKTSDSEKFSHQTASYKTDETPARDNSSVVSQDKIVENITAPEATPVQESQGEVYQVISVVDGDTIKVNYQGKLTSVRLIGVNTPETVDPRKSVECFGLEASNFLKNKLANQTVTLVADPSQTNRDKYDRLLRYVYLDGVDINLEIIQNGYGYEYTYNVPYVKQSEYKQAQVAASAAGRGLWAANTCAATSAVSDSNQSHSPANSPNTCQIKGNINSEGEKIYHLPGQRYYEQTKIDTSKGERWFCSEQEALYAGWRAAKV